MSSSSRELTRSIKSDLTPEEVTISSIGLLRKCAKIFSMFKMLCFSLKIRNIAPSVLIPLIYHLANASCMLSGQHSIYSAGIFAATAGGIRLQISVLARSRSKRLENGRVFSLFSSSGTSSYLGFVGSLLCPVSHASVTPKYAARVCKLSVLGS